VHPEAVFAHQIVDAQVLADALVRIGEYVADHGLSGEGPYQAARDLLLLTAPHTSCETLKEPNETSLAAAIRLAPHFFGVFPIQGPPGAGKTHIGARTVCTLTKAGKNIGVTANSHKVIHGPRRAICRTNSVSFLRDEWVAVSNPATPTSPAIVSNRGPNETPCRNEPLPVARGR
jgi:hypothetical protein